MTGPATFQKKPVQVQAIQLTGENFQQHAPVTLHPNPEYL